MKNKIMFLFIIIVSIISFVLIFFIIDLTNSKSVLNEESKNTNNFIPLKMEIKEVDNKSITVIITDENDEKETYGQRFLLERFSDGKWEYVKENNGNNCCDSGTYYEIGYTVGDNNQGEMKYNWYSKCGELPKGLYRLSHRYGKGEDHIMMIEFNIE